MTGLKEEFAKQLQRKGFVMGHSEQQRQATKKAVARAAKRGTKATERSSTLWSSVRKEAARAAPVVRAVAGTGETVGEFLGETQIGFTGGYKLQLLKRRGQDLAPPKLWNQQEVELEEMRDLVRLSRAQGTWVAYARWFDAFAAYGSTRGVDVRVWRRDSREHELCMVTLLRSMVNTMRKQYAYGSVNMMVTAVARAAKDFGWHNPRSDEVLAAMLGGLKNLKGMNKRKQQAMLAEHVKEIMAMRKEGDMSLVQWTLIKAIVMVGWMAFLRVSELIGGGKVGGELKDGPSGLDVCDVTMVEGQGAESRLELLVRSAKNDQSMEGHTTTVYADELNGEGCALHRLREWMQQAGLSRHSKCTKGRAGCAQCGRPRCICDCLACGKLFRSVVHGKVRDNALSRTSLTRHLRHLYERLEGKGVVPEGTAQTVSGISLRAGGVTEAAANGIMRELLAGHGRWKSNSGPEQYDRNDKRKFRVISDTLQDAMRKQKKR